MKFLISISLLVIIYNVFTFATESDISNKEKRIYISENLDSQEKIKRIFKWNNEILIKAGVIFYRIDLGEQKALPIIGPGGRVLVDLSSQPDEKYYALCNDGVKYVLFTKNHTDWKLMKLPETIDDEKDKVYLFSDKNHLVLLSNSHIYTYAAGQWKKVGYSQKDGMFGIYDKEDHLILYKNKIFVGHDFGEFGGGLVSLDLNTGEWEEHFSDIPVTGFAINSKDELWVSQGLSHALTIMGAVRKYDGKSWNIFTKNECKSWGGINVNDDDTVTFEEKVYCSDLTAKNWPYDQASFISLAFDSSDNLLLLDRNYGILKYQDKKWMKWLNLTNSKYLGLSSVYVVNQESILVGSVNDGLYVLNLHDNTYYRVTFSKGETTVME